MSPWMAVAVAVALPVVVVATGTGLKYLAPRLRTVVDGIPFTEVTETDDSWLSELPAVVVIDDFDDYARERTADLLAQWAAQHTDTNYRTARDARTRHQQGDK